MALNPFASTVGYLLPYVVSGSIIVSLVLSLPTVGPLLLRALVAQAIPSRPTNAATASHAGRLGRGKSQETTTWPTGPKAMIPPSPKASRPKSRGPGTTRGRDPPCHSLAGPRGEGYRRMIEVSAAGRPGTPDEVGTVGALLMGPDGGFITGSDILMDGGVTAAYWYGELAPQ